MKLYLVPFSNQVSNLLLRNIFLHMFSSLWGFSIFCDFNLTLYYYCFIVTVRPCTTMQVGAYHDSQIQCVWPVSGLPWWNERQSLWPLLTIIAKHTLCVLASSAYFWDEFFKDRPHYEEQTTAPKWCPCLGAKLHQLERRFVGVVGCVARGGGSICIVNYLSFCRVTL